MIRIVCLDWGTVTHPLFYIIHIMVSNLLWPHVMLSYSCISQWSLREPVQSPELWSSLSKNSIVPLCMYTLVKEVHILEIQRSHCCILPAVNLLYVEFKCLKDYIFIWTHFVSTQPYLDIVVGASWQLLHEPRRIVESTTGVESTTALAIPEWIIGIEPPLETLCTSSITKIVISNKTRYWCCLTVVNIYTGTQWRRKCWCCLMQCCNEGPYVFPWIMSVCETNTVDIEVIYCPRRIWRVSCKSIWRLLLIANNFTTYSGVFHSKHIKVGRRTAGSINVHSTESLGAG